MTTMAVEFLAPNAFAERLAALDRSAGTSLTTQLVELFAAAIASGELVAGAKLPPTRQLAALAGINQLTASRCYRRLAEMGAVVSEVGRGTFVRAAVPVMWRRARAIPRGSPTCSH